MPKVICNNDDEGIQNKNKNKKDRMKNKDKKREGMENKDKEDKNDKTSKEIQDDAGSFLKKLNDTVNSKISSLILFIVIGVIVTFVFCIFGANLLWFLNIHLPQEFLSNPYTFPYLDPNSHLQEYYFKWDTGDGNWGENTPFPSTGSILMLKITRLIKRLVKIGEDIARRFQQLLSGKMEEALDNAESIGQEGGGDVGSHGENPLKCSAASNDEPTRAAFPYNLLKENWLFDTQDPTHAIHNSDGDITAKFMQSIFNTYSISLIKTNTGVNGILQAIFGGLKNMCEMGPWGVAALFFFSIPIFLLILALVAIGSFIGFMFYIARVDQFWGFIFPGWGPVLGSPFFASVTTFINVIKTCFQMLIEPFAKGEKGRLKNIIKYNTNLLFIVFSIVVCSLTNRYIDTPDSVGQWTLGTFIAFCLIRIIIWHINNKKTQQSLQGQ